MIRKLGVVGTAAAMLLVLSASAASGLTSPNWNLNGTYTIPFTCVVGCPSPPDYPYSVTIATTSSETGAVTGTGYYITGGGNPAVTVTGQVTGWDVTLNLAYTDPGLASYNPFVLTGTVDQFGGMSGTASDGAGRTFTWLTTSGTVSLFSECATGSFVPSTGGTVDLATVPGHKYAITATGTYFAGGAGTFDIQADAEYSQDALQRANNDPWTDTVNNYETYGEVLLDLMVDGQNIDWGAYSATHTYTMHKVATDGTLSFAFDIYDVYYPNNTGGLCVSLTDLGNIGTFQGFFAPVNNNDVKNIAKAGQAIPLKFRVLDYNGNPVTDLTGAEVTSHLGVGSDPISDPVEVYSGESGWQYFGDGYWQFNWKTPKDYAGQCRTMTLTLPDGSTHTADFKFK